MVDLVPITALGGDAPARLQRGALSLAELDDLALASLALSRTAEAPSPFGLTLPDVGRCAQQGEIGAFWIGPRRWMLTSAGAAEQDFAAALAGQAPGGAVAEQTDGWTTFSVGSSDGAAPIEALLERLANIDLAAFGPGSATRTLVHHLSAFVLRPAEDRATFLGPRSSAAALWRALAEAAERIRPVTD